jgi:2-polyprenyl-3-methyl-5-hydroxy-6-metoxy-1,4-benzoquinol methylase
LITSGRISHRLTLNARERVAELLDYTGLKHEFFRDKYCLDAGCGVGRWTWAMMQMGAIVDSIDISPEAIAACKTINPERSYILDIMTMTSIKYEFVLCWGVLHHLENPLEGFRKVSAKVRRGGLLHIMVYHKDTQGVYEPVRKIWRDLSEDEKLALCHKYVEEKGGTIHGWWDAFNPRYNWSFHHDEVKHWFKEAGFENMKLVKKHNINMIGRKK